MWWPQQPFTGAFFLTGIDSLWVKAAFTAPILSICLEGEYFFFRKRILHLDGPGSVQLLQSWCPVQQAGAVQDDRDVPKTALCPMLSLLLTQEEVSRDFFSNREHTWLMKWAPSPCLRRLYGVALPLTCTEQRPRTLQCSLLQAQYWTCSFIVQNRRITSWFVLAS